MVLYAQQKVNNELLCRDITHPPNLRSFLTIAILTCSIIVYLDGGHNPSGTKAVHGPFETGRKPANEPIIFNDAT